MKTHSPGSLAARTREGLLTLAKGEVAETLGKPMSQAREPAESSALVAGRQVFFRGVKAIVLASLAKRARDAASSSAHAAREALAAPGDEAPIAVGARTGDPAGSRTVDLGAGAAAGLPFFVAERAACCGLLVVGGPNPAARALDPARVGALEAFVARPPGPGDETEHE